MSNRVRFRIRSVPRAAAAALLAVAAIIGGVAAAAAGVGAHLQLPAISASRLVASVIQASERPGAVAGTVTSHVDLGLPTLPMQGGTTDGPAGLLAEFTGDHRIRLWSSVDGVRVDELLPAAERAIYVSAAGGWVWSSASFTAYRLFDANDVAAAQRAAAVHAIERARLLHLADPIALADQAIGALTPTTAISIGVPARVAGRSAYTLVLTPRDPQTLVGHVDIQIDAATRVPLRVSLFARGATDAAVSAGFDSVGFGHIDPSVYRFVPPRGAKIETVKQAYDSHGRLDGRPIGYGGPAGVAVQTFGAGWSTIVAVHAPASQLSAAGSATGVDVRQFLPFSGPLFSIRLVTRGDHVWLLAGAVPQSALARTEPQLR